MAYVKKTWANRESEHPTRRVLTPVAGAENTYDVARSEGLVLEDGDAFDAATMNNMEQRIADADSALTTALSSLTVTLLATGWSATAPYTQTVAVEGMTADTLVEVLGPVLSGTQATDAARAEAFALLAPGTGGVESSANALTFYSYDSAPAVELPLCVRGVL